MLIKSEVELVAARLIVRHPNHQGLDAFAVIVRIGVSKVVLVELPAGAVHATVIVAYDVEQKGFAMLWRICVRRRLPPNAFTDIMALCPANFGNFLIGAIELACLSQPNHGLNPGVNNVNSAVIPVLLLVDMPIVPDNKRSRLARVIGTLITPLLPLTGMAQVIAVIQAERIYNTSRTSFHGKPMDVRSAKSIAGIILALHFNGTARGNCIRRFPARCCFRSRDELISRKQPENHDNRQHGGKESRKNVFTCFVQSWKPPFKGSDDRFGDLLCISPPAYISPPPPFMTLKHTPGVDCLESCIY